MVVDISNEVFTKLKTDITNCTIKLGYQEQITSFPCVVLDELDNTYFSDTVASNGENHNSIMYEVNIYTTGNTKISDMKEIRKQVDDIMSGEYGMSRSSSSTTPNYLDTNINRYTMRYDFVIDINKKIYRR